MNVGELYALLTLRAEQYTAGLKTAELEANGFGARAGTAFANVAKKVALIGAAVTLAAVAIGVKATQAWEEQERAINLVNAAYGTAGASVTDWAETNAVKLGVVDNALELSLAKWGVYAHGIGMTTEAGKKAGEDLAERAAQIAAATGGSFEDVFARLQKGVQGATRGLKEYGVAVDPISLRAEALRLGLIHGKEALDLHTKAVATESLILQQTTPYVDAFGKVHDQAGFQVKQIGVIMDETMEAVGKAIVPIVQQVMPVLLAAFRRAAEWIVANMPTIVAVVQRVMDFMGQVFDRLVMIASGVIQAIQPVFDTVGQILGDFSDKLPAVGDMATVVAIVIAAAFAMWAAGAIAAAAATILALAPILIPIALVVAAASAMGVKFSDVSAAIGVAMDVVKQVVDASIGWIVANVLPPLQAALEWFVTNVLPDLVAAFGAVVDWVKLAWPWISDIVGQVMGAVATAFEVVKNVIATVVPIIWAIIEPIGKILFKAIGTAASLLVVAIDTAFKLIGGIWQTLADVGKTLVQGIKDVWNTLSGFFTGLWTGISTTVKGGINFMIGLINGLIKLINGVQIHIPKIGLGPATVGPFDWNGLNLGKIPYLEKGAMNFPGGYAFVGERGPELVQLPQGANVFPHGTGPGMPSVSFGDIIGVQADDVEYAVKKGLRRAAMDLALQGVK